MYTHIFSSSFGLILINYSWNSDIFHSSCHLISYSFICVLKPCSWTLVMRTRDFIPLESYKEGFTIRDETDILIWKITFRNRQVQNAHSKVASSNIL
jgi:hypothetical protein